MKVGDLVCYNTAGQRKKTVGMVLGLRDLEPWDLWEKRTDLLAPLTDLVAECGDSKSSARARKKARTSGKAVKQPQPWRWDEEHETAFQRIKQVIARDVCLAYPQFDKPFVIYTDASTRQLGGVITQDNRPIAFFSRKLTSAQTRYTVTTTSI